MRKQQICDGWKNAYYHLTILYVAILVSAIFGLQVYEFFTQSEAESTTHTSMLALIPVAGVFLHG